MSRLEGIVVHVAAYNRAVAAAGRPDLALPERLEDGQAVILTRPADAVLVSEPPAGRPGSLTFDAGTVGVYLGEARRGGHLVQLEAEGGAYQATVASLAALAAFYPPKE